ncbi:hypothetical protein QDR37_02860 [Amnibacterium sp. CER49]|uniref:hypothetical protein n=1 Tax=Amnibacterium sp. CER49 TaxID=3039161 RepID=UPI00244A0A73|nr:hypothetical protein [Amnibacterium sp. CER49]MDH2442879.1 hypothetical protein [Amnibacterium sp. CER49]
MIAVDAVAVLLAIVVVVAVVVAVSLRRSNPGQERQPRITDDHVHEWGRWTVLKQIEVHVYPDPDEGRDLPDRIDGVVTRTCRICGLPQTKTVRGL